MGTCFIMHVGVQINVLSFTMAYLVYLCSNVTDSKNLIFLASDNCMLVCVYNSVVLVLALLKLNQCILKVTVHSKRL